MSSRPDNPELLIQRIQAGDSDLREQFIADSIPFVKRAVRRITHSFFVEQEDEYSIALAAYDQAISRYEVGKDVPFEAFAALLIKNRILNWLRDQKNARKVLTMTDCELDDGTSLADRLADPGSDQIQQNLEFEEAMVNMELQLRIFGLTMMGLADRLPHHKDTRMLCIRAARQLSEEDALYTSLMNKRRLPCASLARRCEIPVKTIEKNRSSIIFFALLLKSELDVIRSYMATFEEGSK